MSKPTGKLKFAYDTIMAFEECIAELEAENAQLQARLHEVSEIYAGAEGFKPKTAPEAYCLRVMEQMYQAALTEGEK